MSREIFLTLLTKKISGDISDCEIQLLNEIIADNEEYLSIHQAIIQYKSESMHPANKEPDLQKVWRNIHMVKNSNSSVVKMYKVAGWAAAVLLILFGSGYFIFKSKLYNLNGADLITVESRNRRLNIILDEGTKLSLNKNTVVSYNRAFGKNKRYIKLNGSAFFDVQTNKNVPLLVEAGNINIEVKGTAFNVNNHNNKNKIEVELLQGIIEVSNRYNKNNTVLMYPNQKLIVQSEREKNIQFQVRPFIAKQETNPKNQSTDTLLFKKQMFKDLAIQLAKKYAMEIEINDPSLRNKRFSGIFTNESITEALDYLTISYPFTYTIQGNHVMIK